MRKLCAFLSFSMSLLTLSACELSVSNETISTVSRAWRGGGPCARWDYICMNAAALGYVNSIRTTLAVPPIAIGTISMLEAAIIEAYAMLSAGLTQAVRAALAPGCSAVLSGLNVAKNHVELGLHSAGTDPARMCVDQFARSAPHLDSMASTVHRFFVMGVLVDDTNNIWCVQLFATAVRFTNSGSCKRATNIVAESTPSLRPSTQYFEGSASPSPFGPLPTPSQPSLVSKCGHVFKHMRFSGVFSGEQTALCELGCKEGECRYCCKMPNNVIGCLAESVSINIDNQLEQSKA